MKKSVIIGTCWLLLLVALLVGCGGEEPEVSIESTDEPAQQEQAPLEATDEPAATDEPPAEPEPTDEPAAPAGGAISSFQDVKGAIVQIEAQGSFVDPAEGLQLNNAGRGSGFIIDESGLAVTNNHVVTGAAFLQVWVGGEGDPKNAVVLGVSECSDLAVIDIEGEGYDYLDWYDGEAGVGLEIYVAGFPLGEPEYTMTRGIVSKAEANGETQWSSVDHVFEYDANTNPGNSGGAVVDEQGQVVAVHFAGNNSTRQAFGISHDVAGSIVQQLQQGNDVNSIGINGTAINDGEGLSGIWVASVESGSPAERAGVRGGDIITRLEGLILSTDGTMSDYCDILRSHAPEDVLGIEVYRFDTDEVMEGQLNGTPLEHSFSFAQDLEESGVDDPSSETYGEYVGIYDDAESVYMEVPTEWFDVDGAPWEDEGEIIGANLAASNSLDGLYGNYNTPGVIMFASAGLGGTNMGELADLFDFTADCSYDGRSDYEDPIFTGVFDLYFDCLGEPNTLIVLAAEPEDESYAVVLLGQAVTSADFDALDHVLDTFNVVGTLPGS